MKPLSYSLIAAAVACGFATAQTTAYTTPVGYTTQTLAANAYNLVGINLMTPTLVASKVTGVAGAVISDSAINFTTVLPAGAMCILEVTDGLAAGTVQEFTTWAGNDITVPLAITGLAVGDSYRVRVAITLQEVFPIGLLQGSNFASTADKVWVPNGSGGYTKYWHKANDATNPWHLTGTGSNDLGAVTAPVPLVYTDAILVEKKGTVKDLVISGEVKTKGSNSIIINGFNPLGVTPPVGLTLLTSGIRGDIFASNFASTADKVWVPNGSGGYNKYWVKANDATNPWHSTSTGSNDTGAVTVDVPLPAAVLIERKGGAGLVSMDVPASYSTL